MNRKIWRSVLAKSCVPILLATWLGALGCAGKQAPDCGEKEAPVRECEQPVGTQPVGTQPVDTQLDNLGLAIAFHVGPAIDFDDSGYATGDLSRLVALLEGVEAIVVRKSDGTIFAKSAVRSDVVIAPARPSYDKVTGRLVKIIPFDTEAGERFSVQLQLVEPQTPK